eukprot:9481253-Lingulodinium_polyedra.AAC.1
MPALAKRPAPFLAAFRCSPRLPARPPAWPFAQPYASFLRVEAPRHVFGFGLSLALAEPRAGP